MRLLTSVGLRVGNQFSPAALTKLLREKVEALAVVRIRAKAPRVEQRNVVNVIPVYVVRLDDNGLAAELSQVLAEVVQLQRWPVSLYPPWRPWKEFPELPSEPNNLSGLRRVLMTARS
ncbi:MAG: hypothetical protein HY268_11830 [Deltaproteobacteria bacterium]|nr:hypothetical protein [Deltaproteobacteria bacterium]